MRLHPTDDNNFFTFYAVSSHTLVEVYQIGQQGRRKHQKVGEGAVSRGTFRMKMAPKKISPEMLAGGGGINAIINQRSLRQKCNQNNIFHFPP